MLRKTDPTYKAITKGFIWFQFWQKLEKNPKNQTEIKPLIGLSTLK